MCFGSPPFLKMRRIRLCCSLSPFPPNPPPLTAITSIWAQNAECLILVELSSADDQTDEYVEGEDHIYSIKRELMKKLRTLSEMSAATGDIMVGQPESMAVQQMNKTSLYNIWRESTGRSSRDQNFVASVCKNDLAPVTDRNSGNVLLYRKSDDLPLIEHLKERGKATLVELKKENDLKCKYGFNKPRAEYSVEDQAIAVNISHTTGELINPAVNVCLREFASVMECQWLNDVIIDTFAKLIKNSGSPFGRGIAILKCVINSC